MRLNKDVTPFKLIDEESDVVELNMRSPWIIATKEIDHKAKALNNIYANTTVITVMDNTSENKLIHTAYIAVDIEPVTTTQTETTKSYLNRDGKPLELVGEDFTFQLKQDGKVLQTKTNDKDCKIT